MRHERSFLWRRESNATFGMAIKRTISIYVFVFFLGALCVFFFDTRAFSDPLHDLGRTFVRVGMPLSDAVASCPSLMKYACIHGAIMEYAKRENREPSDALETCNFLKEKRVRYTNCVHGIGHYLFMKSTSLHESLNICDALDEASQSACSSGVFMEYALSTHGGHRHMLAYRELPCADLADRYRSTCYASAGSYRQYRQGFETFEESRTYCRSAPREFQDVCLVNVEERARLSRFMGW